VREDEAEDEAGGLGHLFTSVEQVYALRSFGCPAAHAPELSELG
jgi:hypothetical protein